MLIGGEVNRDTGGIYGPWTAKQLEGLDFRLQKTFLGVDGINILEGNKISITIGNLSEISAAVL